MSIQICPTCNQEVLPLNPDSECTSCGKPLPVLYRWKRCEHCREVTRRNQATFRKKHKLGKKEDVTVISPAPLPKINLDAYNSDLTTYEIDDD